MDLTFEHGGDASGGRYHGWVAAYNEEGRKVGYLDWATDNDEDPETGGRLWVKMVEVDPEYRGRGVADAMLDFVVERQYTMWDYPVPVLWSDYLTPEGSAWWKKVVERYPNAEPGAVDRLARVAVRIDVAESPIEIPYLQVRAYDGDQQVGLLDGPVFNNVLRIDQIFVEEEYRRQGIATQMLDAIREEYDIVDVLDNDNVTQDGRGFMESVESGLTSSKRQELRFATDLESCPDCEGPVGPEDTNCATCGEILVQ